MAAKTKPEKGSERVKAWVYAILNPVIEALRRETGLLKSSNLSWRFHTKRCEYIRPVEELIDPSHLPILDDLLAEDPILQERFREHASEISRLEESAARFFQGLIQAAPFREQVSRCLEEYSVAVRASNPTYPDLDAVSRTPEYVAEYLVNNIKSLPRHHTMYAFWQRFEPEFSEFKKRETFTRTGEAAGRLSRVSERLQSDLESLRLTLCREYDIPAAPIEPPRGAYAENALPRFR
jgi:hypothetical protein